ncbi:sugar ABC transporter ATP-binding protein [Kaistia dalseonensis]|uniref:ABC-type sugar transport system ATPase subunit n=1 Tax=Kaistia dalseonensis TaxID=410840 RepID=A0ABU0HFY1_9HYPH|nr:sugar ABC transporter ATP-binding protein [Kaistia dalseonensis]MCX5497797.1 sugar ABC transporter ATP-binding protein [Kaistia dalseonensis]MDQ0440441.1 ABC-type sugar transport system ATPase subunit [Kaistia dalseonensis]
MPEIAISLVGIEKSFGSAKILNGITLDFRRGSVHALIGENGAGKSSLGKIIGGYYSFDAGTLTVFGKPVGHWTPRAALQGGIAMIHQELQLVPELTVAQNVFLGIEDNSAGVLRGSEAARFRALDEKCGFGLKPGTIVADLRIAERQKVEIMRAIARDSRVIIMDEPTSSLTADEAEKLHHVIRWLRDDGRTVIYVTHFLDHVLATADRVTIMRDGRIVRSGDIAGETKASLVEAMLGEPADVAFPPLPAPPALSVAPILEISHLSSDTGLQDVSLDIRPGEIVGLIGLVGSGRSELARAIFGADPATGAVKVAGAPYDDRSPRRSVARGIGFVPEDRRKQGLDLVQMVRPNMSLPHLALVSRFGVLRPKEERRRTAEMIRHFNIVPGQIDGEVAFYSGGNQQKVLLSKWVYGNPKIVILDEPSRGVDIGARRRIHDFVVELARGGAAVLLISSELEEVISLSHRGYLMSEGRIVGTADCRTLTVEDALFRLFNIDRSAGDTARAGATS